ncbi:MAG: GNAT family N-acetyltransferase [Marinovum sp.]|nr:GNAT family N-acetyltransferase [Marinovum sp.]
MSVLGQAAEITPTTFRVRTPRLTLREMHPEDSAACARIGGQEAVAPMLLSVTSPWPMDAVQDWIAKSRWTGRPALRLAILRDDALIGVVGAGPGPKEASMMYFIDPTHWGHGYASEAAEAFIDALFDHFQDLGVLVADHFIDNPASGRVLRKLGFEETGRSFGESAARLEPEPVIDYRLTRAAWESPREIS